MNDLLIIGDVHGNTDYYHKIIKSTNLHSIQVGDFGFEESHNWYLKNIDSNKHKINFGNHDNTNFLKEKYSLGDYGMYNKHIMTVRGADSVDKTYRIEGADWWRNEELNYQEMQNAIDFYTLHKPKIMITHDCPQSIREKQFNIFDKSITSNGLQAMFEIHQPDLWIFGHHHKSVNINHNNTNFICLRELEFIII